MISKTLTAAALVAGLMTVTAEAAPKRGGVDAKERAATRQLNEQQLASAGATAPVGSAMDAGPAAAPMAPSAPMGSSGMETPAMTPGQGSMGDPANTPGAASMPAPEAPPATPPQ